MTPAAKVVCPHCGTHLKSAEGPWAGQEVLCPGCAAPFTVLAAGAPATPGTPAPAGQPAGVNLARLGVALGGLLLYLLGGTALALYCFTCNADQPDPTHAGALGPQGGPEDEAEPPPPPSPGPTAPLPAADQRKVDDALANGVWFLKDHTLPSGTWGDTLPINAAPAAVGFASLPGLTLLECDVPGTDPVVRKAADHVRQQAPAVGNSYDTYQRALAILFLDRLGEKGDEELIRYLALCPAAGQRLDDGGWGYSCPALDRKGTPELLELLRDDKKPLDQWRQAALKGETFDPGPTDNSNTQFAILALWVARRHQVPIDRSIALAEKRFRDTQLHGQAGAPLGDPTGNNLDLDGSWSYQPGVNSSAWPSMTCSGLLGLAVAHGVARDLKTKKQQPLHDPAIKAGLAMLAREMDRPDEKRAPDYYYLWSLERVGVLYNLPAFEKKDWYAWGRKALLPRQQADGSWKDGAYYGNTPVIDTCFALLFLKQANLAKDLTTKLQLLTRKK